MSSLMLPHMWELQFVSSHFVAALRYNNANSHTWRQSSVILRTPTKAEVFLVFPVKKIAQVPVWGFVLKCNRGPYFGHVGTCNCLFSVAQISWIVTFVLHVAKIVICLQVTGNKDQVVFSGFVYWLCWVYFLFVYFMAKF